MNLIEKLVIKIGSGLNYFCYQILVCQLLLMQTGFSKKSHFRMSSTLNLSVLGQQLRSVSNRYRKLFLETQRIVEKLSIGKAYTFVNSRILKSSHQKSKATITSKLQRVNQIQLPSKDFTKKQKVIDDKSVVNIENQQCQALERKQKQENFKDQPKLIFGANKNISLAGNKSRIIACSIKNHQRQSSLLSLKSAIEGVQQKIDCAKNELKKHKKIENKIIKNENMDFTNNSTDQPDLTKLNIVQEQISDSSFITIKKLNHNRISSSHCLLKSSTQSKEAFKTNQYYIGQAIRAMNQRHSLVVQHISSAIRILKHFEDVCTPDMTMIEAKKLNLEQANFYKGKKTLIFDMDQTLIHCNQNPINDCDARIPLSFDGNHVVACINIRPHALTTLQYLAQHFQIIVFTASESSYADSILDYLDPEHKLFAHRLYREHCIKTQGDIYVKDLRIINRQIEDIILVDNAAYSFAFQLQNGIPILPYYEGFNDCELQYLSAYLQKLKSCKDVRQVNRKFFKLHHYTKFNDPQQLIEQLYS